jgi:hypothetical protein
MSLGLGSPLGIELGSPLGVELGAMVGIALGPLVVLGGLLNEGDAPLPGAQAATANVSAAIIISNSFFTGMDLLESHGRVRGTGRRERLPTVPIWLGGGAPVAAPHVARVRLAADRPPPVCLLSMLLHSGGDAASATSASGQRRT